MPTSARQPRPAPAADPPAVDGEHADAITQLKADHRQVAAWFDDYARLETPTVKMELATRICGALRIHTAIEEEVFYPAFLKAVRKKAVHHEAIVEHAAAGNLIAEIERSDPSDDFYDAKVTVLGEMIRHHVREEEKPGGMFALAKRAKMDLLALGAALDARRRQFIDPNDREADE